MLDLLVRDPAEVGALGEELPQGPVGVLHRRLLSGMVGVAEAGLHASEGLRDIRVPREPLAPVWGERLEGTSL